MTKEINKLFLAFLIAFAIGIPIALWRAYCMTVLWGWYAPPSWGTLPLKDAVGIALAYALVTSKASRKDDPGTLDIVVSAFVGPASVLGFSWIMLFVVR